MEATTTEQNAPNVKQAIETILPSDPDTYFLKASSALVTGPIKMTCSTEALSSTRGSPDLFADCVRRSRQGGKLPFKANEPTNNQRDSPVSLIKLDWPSLPTYSKRNQYIEDSQLMDPAQRTFASPLSE